MRPYEELIVDIPNYPKPGVVFKDLTPAFADADADQVGGEVLPPVQAEEGTQLRLPAEAGG